MATQPVVFYDTDIGPEIREKLNEMGVAFAAAIDNARGPQGWAPVPAVYVVNDTTAVLRVIDWTGGEGSKPTITGYIGATGIVSDPAQAINIQGTKGEDGTVTPELQQLRDDAEDFRDQSEDARDAAQAAAQAAQEVGPGWSAVIALVADSGRIVQKVVGWTGGTGTAPPTNVYIGATGFVNNIADAVNVRGPAGSGAGNVSTSGNVTQGHIAVFADSTGNTISDGGALALVATSGKWADILEKPTVIAAGSTASQARDAIGAGTSNFSGAYGDLSNKPTLGTSSSKNVAESGNAASNEVVKGDDTRLTDARTPTSHGHTISDVQGLSGALNAKQDASSLSADSITDATPVGKALIRATDAAAGRSAIGAGTSNLVIGTTASTAKSGAYTPTINEIADAANGAANKNTPADADAIILVDSTQAAGSKGRQTPWAKVKETLKAYFDNLYAATGRGLPAGGTTGQFLKKTSNADYAASWADAPSGGGSDYILLQNFNITDGMGSVSIPITRGDLYSKYRIVFEITQRTLSTPIDSYMQLSAPDGATNIYYYNERRSVSGSSIQVNQGSNSTPNATLNFFTNVNEAPFGLTIELTKTKTSAFTTFSYLCDMYIVADPRQNMGFCRPAASMDPNIVLYFTAALVGNIKLYGKI